MIVKAPVRDTGALVIYRACFITTHSVVLKQFKDNGV